MVRAVDKADAMLMLYYISISIISEAIHHLMAKEEIYTICRLQNYFRIIKSYVGHIQPNVLYFKVVCGHVLL